MTYMQPDTFNQFLLWWSIISTVLGVAFLLWDIWQFASNKKEKTVHKSQVKIWQHHASAIFHGSTVLVQGEFSSVKDVQQAAKITQAAAMSMQISLNEERLFSEQEIKEQQIANKKRNDELLDQARSKSHPVAVK